MRSLELEELATYRLDRQLTFLELEAAMAAAGYPLPMRTLHRALTDADQTPHELTLHQVRRFVEHERDAGRLPHRADTNGQQSAEAGQEHAR